MMIVPSFWAEARVQYRRNGKQITVRRFGWSDASQDNAQQNAQLRVDDALARAVSGEPLPRRERKVPYNGGDGLPIREEVVDRFGETVITRNAYGARCINTPNVLFVDIDFNDGPGKHTVWGSALFLLAAAAVMLVMMAAAGKSPGSLLAAAVIGVVLAWLERYDRAAAGFAACRYIESIGKGAGDPAAQAVQRLHDELCQARSRLPIA